MHLVGFIIRSVLYVFVSYESLPITFKYCVTQKLLLWRLLVAGNCETYLGLHAKCQIFLSYFVHVWSFWIDFHESSQYQISRKSVQWVPRRYVQTDRHDEVNGRFSQLCEHD